MVFKVSSQGKKYQPSNINRKGLFFKIMGEQFSSDSAKSRIHRQRLVLLAQVLKMSEPIMILLGFAWMVLLLIDLVRGLTSQLVIVSNIIWGIFIIDFTIKLLIAPQKGEFLKKNILTIVSLVIPALRVFRISMFFRFMRVIRATRSIRLARIITSLNRGIRTLNRTLRRRAFGYIMIVTLIILLTGAGGMYAFESHSNITSYWHALWWTAMLMTTMGSEFWPQTPEGRILCLALAIYGFAIFGYITATIASFFIGRDAESSNGEIAGTKQIRQLEKEIQMLRKELSESRKK